MCVFSAINIVGLCCRWDPRLPSPVVTVHREVIVIWWVCWWHRCDSVWFSAYRLSPTYNMDWTQVNSNSLLFTFFFFCCCFGRSSYGNPVQTLSSTQQGPHNKQGCFPFGLNLISQSKTHISTLEISAYSAAHLALLNHCAYRIILV